MARKTKPTKAALAAAAKRIEAAERKRKRQKAKRREKTAEERRRAEAYLDDDLVDRKDGKGKARRFRRGNPGRPPGSENVIPSNVRASVKAIIEKVVRERGASIEDAIVRGIEAEPSDSAKFIKLAAEYTDGKPPQTLTLGKAWNEDELAEAHTRLSEKFSALFVRIDEQLADQEAKDEAGQAEAPPDLPPGGNPE